MQTIETTEKAGQGATVCGGVRGRALAFAETLAASRAKGESLAELAHDARNMVQALALYCELLEEPGVLKASCRHYAGELRLVTASSRRLVEKLSLLGKREQMGTTRPVALSLEVPERPIDDLRQELLGMQHLLNALAGPAISVVMTVPEGALPVWLTAEDLTRVLVNLVKNASEAIHELASSRLGRIVVGLAQRGAAAVLLTVEDSGPGIDPGQLDAIFEPGFTTNAHGSWPAAHRGLGLFICRSIVEAAGGKMQAVNRDGGGARIEIELPVRAH
jgi:signal transduction histidine kinase